MALPLLPESRGALFTHRCPQGQLHAPHGPRLEQRLSPALFPAAQPKWNQRELDTPVGACLAGSTGTRASGLCDVHHAPCRAAPGLFGCLEFLAQSHLEKAQAFYTSCYINNPRTFWSSPLGVSRGALAPESLGGCQAVREHGDCIHPVELDRLETVPGTMTCWAAAVPRSEVRRCAPVSGVRLAVHPEVEQVSLQCALRPDCAS
ncbi:PREDICTED: uncharacterized protein LOC102022048 [Chinchilla lanigera]|uniref:uncharacterized protein LOC102022048 n=1 Tax=Chinchilla lanigera TaxID=34839 RepID=UPI000697F3C8|nr:PREDICTED: uncharacterized protein LOC102022048 [Chinchilla lanigera]